jgi:sulfate/thiosulfate transport system permease protein
MSDAPRTPRSSLRGHPRRRALVLAGAGGAGLLICLPLGAVFYYALRDGLHAYWSHLTATDTVHAIGLSLLAAGIALPINTAFGLTAAWSLAKFEFPGRRIIISLIELPLSISPIIIGVAYLFVFGMQGLLGPWLDEHGITLAFNVASIVVVTTIVTTPYVFREVLPLMLTQGTNEEQAGVTLGAGGWQVFRRITLPNIKWAVFYGMALSFARSLGEFGSVSVVSGAVRGETNTMTLQIDLLYHDHVQTAAFAVASILTSFALVTLLLKTWVERREVADASTSSS